MTLHHAHLQLDVVPWYCEIETEILHLDIGGILECGELASKLVCDVRCERVQRVQNITFSLVSASAKL